METLHLIGRLIGENTRALIKKQKLGHTLLHRDGQQDWMYSSVCVCVCLCIYVCAQFLLCIRAIMSFISFTRMLFTCAWIYPRVIFMCSVLMITQISNYFYIIVNIIKILYVVTHTFLSSQHQGPNVLVVRVAMHALHPVMNK